MTQLEKPSVPGLSRGIQVLRLLARPMTLDEVVRQAGVPRSSVQRILATLLEEGLVEKDPDTKAYRALAAHGHDSGGADEMQRELEAAMARLAEEAGRTVEWFLPTTAGHVLARREVPANASERVHTWIGWVRPWAGHFDAVNCISRGWWSKLPEEGEEFWTYGPDLSRIEFRQDHARLQMQEAVIRGYAEDKHPNEDGVRRVASIVWGSKMPLGCLAIAYGNVSEVEAQMERNRQLLMKETWDLSILGKRFMPQPEGR